MALVLDVPCPELKVGVARRELRGVAGFSEQVKRRVWIPGNMESAPSWV